MLCSSSAAYSLDPEVIQLHSFLTIQDARRNNLISMAESGTCRRLHGKVAVVTAATAGIGLGIAERLASEGARVMICSRGQQNVDETVQALRAKGLHVSGVVCHVGNAQQRAYLIKQTMQEFGQLDILISNAAVSPTHAVRYAALVQEGRGT